MVSVGSGTNRYRQNFRTKEEAEIAERKEILYRKGIIDRTERPQGAPQDVTLSNPHGHTLRAAFKLTCRDMWSQRKSDASIKAGTRVLKALGEDTLCSAVTTQVIREMIDEMEDVGNTGATINKKLSALSMMLKTAADEGWIETMPRIKRRANGTHRVRWLDVDEEQQVLYKTEQLGLLSLKDFIICAIDTGFRRGELMNFKVADYRDGMLHLHPDETKTSKARAVPATDRVHEIIVNRRHNTKLFDEFTENKIRMHWDTLRYALGKADDPQFVIHMLRHTCASRLAMQDKPAQFIQEWMGHTTPLTTARYMHLAPAKLREGKEALENYRRPELKVVTG